MGQRIVNETKAPLEGSVMTDFRLCAQFVDIYDQNTAKKMPLLNLNTMESVGMLKRNVFQYRYSRQRALV